MARDAKLYKQQGTSIPYGGAQQLNEAAAAVRRSASATTLPPSTGMGIQTPPLDLTPQNEIEAALFGPTKLPNQPITAGAPFGPGASQVRIEGTDEDILRQAGNELLAVGSEKAKQFGARILSGE